MFAVIDFGLSLVLLLFGIAFLVSKLGEVAKTDAGKSAIGGLIERFLKK